MLHKTTVQRYTLLNEAENCEKNSLLEYTETTRNTWLPWESQVRNLKSATLLKPAVVT